MSGENMLLVLFRTVLGLAMTAFLAFIAWLIMRQLFAVINYDSLAFTIPAAALVGGVGGLGAVVAWWSGDQPGYVRVICIVATLAVSILACWLGLYSVRERIHYTWISGVGTLPIIEQRDAFTAAMATTIMVSNAVAGALSLYRLLFHKEM
jgi:hypothetical protein